MAKLEQRFRALLRQALSTSLRSDAQIGKDVQTLKSFVDANSGRATLDVMLESYLADYASLEKRHDQRASWISQWVFDLIFPRWIESADYFAPRLREGMRLILDRVTAADPPEALFARYLTLDSVKKANVFKQLERKRKNKKASLSFLEILIDLYVDRTGGFPPSEAALWSVTVLADPELRKAYDAKARAFIAAVEAYKIAEVGRLLADFVQWVGAKDDIARGFQAMLWLRADVDRENNKPHRLRAWAWNELYLTSIQRTLISATHTGYQRVTLYFLAEDEIADLMVPLARSSYYSNYDDRLFPYTIDGNAHGGLHFTQLTLMHLSLVMFADQQNISLESAAGRDAIAEDVIQRGQLLKNVRWHFGGRDLGGASVQVRIGQRISGVGRLIWVDTASTPTFEIDGFPQELFTIDRNRLAVLLDDALHREILAGTQHLAVLIPKFFELLGYVHAICTGGMTALLKEVIEELVLDVAVDAASKVMDPRLAQGLGLVVGGASGLVPTGRIAKAGLKTGAKAVRKIVPSWKKSPIARARALKRRLGLARKNPHKLSPQEVAEAKRLKKLDQALAKLEKKQVALGSALASGGYARITGLEAIRMFFQLPMGAITRLAKHWPMKLARESQKMVEDLLTRSAHLNDPKFAKLRKEIRDAIKLGRLTGETVNKLPPALKKELSELVERQWNKVRNDFWKAIYNDRKLHKSLESLGIRIDPAVKTGEVKAPVLKIADYELKFTLDHISRKSENPLQAFDIDNVRVATPMDNSAVKERLVRTPFENAPPLPQWVAKEARKTYPSEQSMDRAIEGMEP